jgi:hypothetical protein
LETQLFNAGVPDTFKSQEPLEGRLEAQAVNVNLREAVMACLSGQESRRWTVGDFVDRFKNLGLSVSRAGVTAALAELEVELELSAWAPWRLVERGTEWILTPKSELLELLGGVRKLPLGEHALSEEHKAVLLVVFGHRRKGGVSKTKIGEILKLDATSYLEDLKRQGLIYSDPSREVKFWRPTPEALLALGFRSSTDIPALKELEQWFDALESRRARPPSLDSYFARADNLQSRRLKRELERRATVRSCSESASCGERIPGQENGSDFLRGDVRRPPLPHPAQEPPESVMQSPAAQARATGPGKKEL